MSGNYSTNLKTMYIEPSTHVRNQMSTFRLDKNSVYLPSMRLVNVGFFSDNDAEQPNALCGYYGCIKNIRLMDGARTLSQLREANRWLSFSNQLGSNQNNLCVKSPMNGSQNGAVLRSDGRVDFIKGTTDRDISKNVASEIKTSTLDLLKVFPILNNLSCIDTSQQGFSQLRIEVEYVHAAASVGSSKSTAVLVIQEPTLVCDMVINEKLADKLKSDRAAISWDELENDVLTAPAAAAVADDATRVIQPTTAVINGFDNKVVGRVLMMKHLSNPALGYDSGAIMGYGPYQSRNYHFEKLQVRLNGTNVFPGANGIDHDGYKNMLLWSSWGDVSIAPYGAAAGVGDQIPTVDIRTSAAGAFNNSGVPPLTSANLQSDKVGAQDYYGFSLEQRVNQLSVTYERSFFKNDAAIFPDVNAAVNVHIFAEVRKSLVFRKGGYDIIYA